MKRYVFDSFALIAFFAGEPEGEKVKEALCECLQGLEITEADKKLTLEAARLKARYPIAYADCFALALAKLKKAELITGDPEFKKAAKEKVEIQWL